MMNFVPILHFVSMFSPSNIYQFKVNKRNTRRCEICSKLTTKTSSIKTSHLICTAKWKIQFQKKILCEIGETELDILKDEKTSQTITLDSREHNHVKFKQNLEKQCAKKRNKFNQHAVKVLNAEKSNKKTFLDHSTLLVKLDLEKKDTFGHLKKNNTPDHLEKTIFHF